jgi:hypothetical protein
VRAASGIAAPSERAVSGMLPIKADYWESHTLEAGSLRQEESGVLPSNSVLSKATTSSQHFMESGNAVTLLELYDIITDLVDDARDIVALVSVVVIGEPACGLVNTIDLPDIQCIKCLPGTFQSLGLLPL